MKTPLSRLFYTGAFVVSLMSANTALAQEAVPEYAGEDSSDAVKEDEAYLPAPFHCVMKGHCGKLVAHTSTEEYKADPSKREDDAIRVDREKYRDDDGREYRLERREEKDRTTYRWEIRDEEGKVVVTGASKVSIGDSGGPLNYR